MTMSGFANLLQRETTDLRDALPSSLTDLFWPRTSMARATSAVAAQTVIKEPALSRWFPWLSLAALVLGAFWLLQYLRRPADSISSMARGTADRLATDVYRLGEFVNRALPNNVNLNIPERGVEARILGFIQDPGAKPDETTWFAFDRLVFDTGSATLRPGSQEQLNNIAMILNAYPKVHLKVGGYTDSVGDPGRNRQLSQDRANAVMAELIRKGVASSRLEAEGYGEAHPLADNLTEAGQAQNRRVSMRITQK
jgi:outer membrane protein OmpA-like peptidoglycan-associated protein